MVEAALRQDIVFGLGSKTIGSTPCTVGGEEVLSIQSKAISLLEKLQPSFHPASIAIPAVRRPVFIMLDSRGNGFVVKTSADGLCDSAKLAYEYDVLTCVNEAIAEQGTDLMFSAPEPVYLDSHFLIESYVSAKLWADALNSCDDGWEKNAYALGRSLRWMHITVPKLINSDTSRFKTVFPVPPFPRFDPETYCRGIGPEFPLLLSAYQDCEGVINQLRSEWNHNEFVHYDARSQNILLKASGEPCVIDWEIAGLGDGAFDLGMVLADAIKKEYELRYRKQAFMSWRDFARILLAGYCKCDNSDIEFLSARSMQYAAVALLMRSAEKLHANGRLSRVDTLTLQSARILIEGQMC